MARTNTITMVRTTRANLNTQASAGGLLAGEPYYVTDEDVLAIGKTATTYVVPSGGLVKGVPLGIAGTMSASEKVVLYPVVYAGSLTATNSFVKSLTAATASATLTIKRNGTGIGGIIFNAGSTTGVITINTPTLVYGDIVTIEAPSTADSTLADIVGVLRIS